MIQASSLEGETMATEFYLFQVPDDTDFDTAMELFEEFEFGEAEPQCVYDRHRLAKFLIKLDPRYEIFAMDYEEIAKLEDTSAEEARGRYDYLELNGQAGDKPMAQFTIYDNHVNVEWHSGTTEEEMNRYLVALSQETGYTVVDPQTGELVEYTAE
jgi:hypothetical protein